MIAIALSSGSVACWVPKETGEVMQRDIAKLRAELQENEKGLDEQRALLAEQTEKAEEQVKQVEKTLQDLNRAARSTDADFGVQLEQLRKEMAELRGQIELANFRLSQLEQKLEGEGSLTARIEALETGLPTGDNPPPAPTPPAADVPKDEAGLVAHGKNLVKEGKLDDARGVFRQVINKWPKKAGATDVAYFELGEIYFKEKKYRSALQEYIHVVEKFGSGKIADDAYYRIGECSMQLGNYEDAKIFFEEILRNHKKSPLVKPARNKLREVERRMATEKKGKKGRKK